MPAIDLTESELDLIRQLRATNNPARPNRKPVIWIYIRYSHRDSAATKLSEDIQRTQSMDYAAALKEKLGDVTVAEPMVERAVSARKHNLKSRPQGKILCAQVAPGDHVVFARLDRAFRCLSDMAATCKDWIDRDISPHFVDKNINMSDTNGKLIAHILAAVAQWQSDYISDRSKENAAELKKRGKPNGRPRLGTKSAGRKHRTRAVDHGTWPIACQLWLVREKFGLSYAKLSDWIEQWFASREGRKPRYQWDREWTVRRCKNAVMRVEDARKESPKAAQQLDTLLEQTQLDGEHLLPPDVKYPQPILKAG